MAGFMESLLEPAQLSSTSTAKKPRRNKGLRRGMSGSAKLGKPRVATGPVRAQQPVQPKTWRRQMLGGLVRSGVGRKKKKG